VRSIEAVQSIKLFVL